MRPRPPLVLTAAVALLGGCAGDEPQPRDDKLEELGRCTNFDPLRQPFFGDTHVHTQLSLDANLQGNRLRPIDAYRFARGEEVGVQPYDADGNALRRLQLARPLDFVALSDHAEFLGVVRSCTDPDSVGFESEACTDYRSDPDRAFIRLNAKLTTAQGDAERPAPCSTEEGACPDAELGAWQEVQDAAEAAYDRSEACTFTSFVAYEWSGSPGALNLHRNVIFRNHRVPAQPTSYFDENHEDGLWRQLRDQCTDAGTACEALAIPHNSNLSSGLMFETVDENGRPFDDNYAQLRAQFEPLVEVFQHKGDSECLPGTPASDELCDFEKLPYSTLASANLGTTSDPPRESDFVRHALGQGMLLGRSLGTNPFQLGIIASTDTHLGTPGAVDERGFVGHGGAGLAVRDVLPPGLPDRAWFNPGGLAVLWAEENSREALFEAMRRREAYGTSGTRIVLRVFGGWGYPDNACQRPDTVELGYQGGVPMGGTLGRTGEGPPRFIVSAARDPMGAPLSHVQVIKGWLEGDAVRWQVFDIAGDPNSGAAVDPSTCAPTPASEELGADALCAVWSDPAFDPQAEALYYVRVIENPTCRWHAYLCNDAGVDCDDPSTVTEGFEGCCTWDPEQRERAWSSPIWYTP